MRKKEEVQLLKDIYLISIINQKNILIVYYLIINKIRIQYLRV